MPGVPITNLRELLMLQQIQQQANPLFTGLQSLAEGVSTGIEKQREAALEKKKSDEQFATDTSRAKEFAKTYGGEIEATFKGGKAGFSVEQPDGTKIPTQAEIAKIDSITPQEGFVRNPNYGLVEDAKPFVKGSTSITKESDLFSDARDLGISTEGKDVADVRREVTANNRARLANAQTEIDSIDKTDLAPEISTDSTGKTVVKWKPKTILGGTITEEEKTTIIDGMEDGAITPDIRAFSRSDRSILAAAAQERGLNLNAMTAEQQAVKKWITSTNSVKQVNLRQVIDSVLGSMSNLKKLNKDFERFGWTPANKAAIALASTGTGVTKEVQEAAIRYKAQIKLLTDELGQIFMGGNSPTDKALKLAEEVLNENYNYDQMVVTMNELEKNIHYRKNAIDSSGPQLPGGQVVGSPFLPTSRGAFTDNTDVQDDMLDQKKALYNDLRSKGHSVEYSRGRAGL